MSDVWRYYTTPLAFTPVPHRNAQRAERHQRRKHAVLADGLDNGQLYIKNRVTRVQDADARVCQGAQFERRGFWVNGKHECKPEEVGVVHEPEVRPRHAEDLCVRAGEHHLAALDGASRHRVDVVEVRQVTRVAHPHQRERKQYIRGQMELFLHNFFISYIVPVVLAPSYLAFVHAKVVRHLVPDGVAHNLRYGDTLLPRGLLDRPLVERNSVGHGSAHAVPVAARGGGYAVIVAEQRFVLLQPLHLAHLRRRLVINQKRDVLDMRAELGGNSPLKLLCHQLFKLLPSHLSKFLNFFSTFSIFGAMISRQ